MSNDDSSRFFELKTFYEHLEACRECQTKLILDELFGEIMIHAQQMEDNEMLKERMKQNEKLMEV